MWRICCGALDRAHSGICHSGGAGAGQGQVIRQLLTESMVLACSGGGFGSGTGGVGHPGGYRADAAALPRAQSVHIDARVLLFTLGASVLAGIFFGLAPALRTSNAELQATLKEGGRGSSAARHRLQGLFVVAEMAMALVLLVGAGLMIRSLANLWSVQPGFDPRHVITFSISRPGSPGAAPDAFARPCANCKLRWRRSPGWKRRRSVGVQCPCPAIRTCRFGSTGSPNPRRIRR